MSQDVVSDALNQIMNAKRMESKEIVIRRYSKVLINLLEIMKKAGHLDFQVNSEEKTINLSIIKINECKAVKPRNYVKTYEIERYLKRFIPSRRFGNLILSTDKGLLNHKDAIKNKVGGSLIAYFY